MAATNLRTHRTATTLGLFQLSVRDLAAAMMKKATEMARCSSASYERGKACGGTKGGRGAWCVVGREPGAWAPWGAMGRGPGRCAQRYGAVRCGCGAVRCGCGAHHEEGECDAERLRERRVELDDLGPFLAARGHVEQREEEDEGEEHGVEGRVDVRGERGGAVDRAARGAQDVMVGQVHPTVDVEVAVGEEGVPPEDLGQGDEGEDGHERREEAAPRVQLGGAPLLELRVIVHPDLLGQQQQRQEGKAGEPERLGHRKWPPIEERPLAPRAPLGAEVAVGAEGERGECGEARQENAEHCAAALDPARRAVREGVRGEGGHRQGEEDEVGVASPGVLGVPVRVGVGRGWVGGGVISQGGPNTA